MIKEGFDIRGYQPNSTLKASDVKPSSESSSVTRNFSWDHETEKLFDYLKESLGVNSYSEVLKRSLVFTKKGTENMNVNNVVTLKAPESDFGTDIILKDKNMAKADGDDRHDWLGGHQDPEQRYDTQGDIKDSLIKGTIVLVVVGILGAVFLALT